MSICFGNLVFGRTSVFLAGEPQYRIRLLCHCFYTSRRNCNCQSLQEPQSSTAFHYWHATGSISISYKPQLSTDFNNLWNLVRDQGVGGSNPLSPTNYFQPLTPTAKAQNPTPWFCTRFHHIPERRNPHHGCTSVIARDAGPST